MKKVQIFIAMLLLATISMNAQYDKVSLQGELGATKIRDETNVQLFNFDLGARYMFNTKWGIELSGNYASLKDYKWQSATFMGIANVGRVMNFEEFTDKWTILIGIGGNYEYNNSYTNQAIFHRLSNFHLAGNITNEYKLTNKIFLTAGLNVVTGVNSRPLQPEFHYTETTSILNFNAGITVAIGKHKEHADWYIEHKVANIDTVYMQPIVHKNTETIVNNLITNQADVQYVFFDNNSYKVEKQGLNAIRQVAKLWVEGKTFTIKGYASPPAGVNYNFRLSDNRAKAVRAKAVSEGVPFESIKIEKYGEVDTFDGKNVDLSRYVEISIQ